ncbi:hypothetical protein [Candidatus Contubernalis alkaliaceticus]|uniref:hypothetical protein n=1 Tax=Candidatus Contubernalis alkaliaceticus TaxID=338645 RepID=UPI001F4C28EC|nr:hypothetical protein [Candidatus Contubernalis alkalaceticus]UNC91132.1 hypothetical protein HUE98_02935 [Candidatus Contubernalis alkalaceticus]
MSYLWLYSGGLRYILLGVVFLGASCLAVACILIMAAKRRQVEEQNFVEKMQKLSAGKSKNIQDRKKEPLEEETELLIIEKAEEHYIETELLNDSEEPELLIDQDKTEFLEEETELLNDQDETEYFSDNTEVLDRS